jgi:hypothetical protein
MRTFTDDYQFGTTSEEQTLSTILTLDPTLHRNQDKYSPFDYNNAGNTTFVELKTRNNAKNKYPTTMIPLSKVKIAEKNPSKTYYFAFKFTDGLYYIQYDKNLFDTFEVKEGGRWDRGRPELNQYLYIPVNKLTALLVDVCDNTLPN